MTSVVKAHATCNECCSSCCCCKNVKFQSCYYNENMVFPFVDNFPAVVDHWKCVGILFSTTKYTPKDVPRIPLTYAEGFQIFKQSERGMGLSSTELISELRGIPFLDKLTDHFSVSSISVRGSSPPVEDWTPEFSDAGVIDKTKNESEAHIPSEAANVLKTKALVKASPAQKPKHRSPRGDGTYHLKKVISASETKSQQNVRQKIASSTQNITTAAKLPIIGTKPPLHTRGSDIPTTMRKELSNVEPLFNQASPSSAVVMGKKQLRRGRSSFSDVGHPTTPSSTPKESIVGTVSASPSLSSYGSRTQEKFLKQEKAMKKLTPSLKPKIPTTNLPAPALVSSNKPASAKARQRLAAGAKHISTGGVKPLSSATKAKTISPTAAKAKVVPPTTTTKAKPLSSSVKTKQHPSTVKQQEPSSRKVVAPTSLPIVSSTEFKAEDKVLTIEPKVSDISNESIQPAFELYNKEQYPLHNENNDTESSHAFINSDIPKKDDESSEENFPLVTLPSIKRQTEHMHEDGINEDDQSKGVAVTELLFARRKSDPIELEFLASEVDKEIQNAWEALQEEEEEVIIEDLQNIVAHVALEKISTLDAPHEIIDSSLPE